MHDPCQCFRIKVTSCKQGRALGTLLKKQKEKTSNASVWSKGCMLPLRESGFV